MTKLIEYLDAVKKRREMAFPGPWDARCRLFSNSERPVNIWSEFGWLARVEGKSSIENAEFIAAAPIDSEKLERMVRIMMAALLEIREEEADAWQSHWAKTALTKIERIAAGEELR